MRRILSLVILLAILTGGDLLLRNIAEQQVADQVKSEMPANAHVSASIPVFPFVPRVVFWGSVPKVNVKVTNVQGPPLNLAEARVSISGVVINRHHLLNKRRIELVSIDKGTVEAVVTQDALSDVLHAPVKITGGTVSLTVAGQSVTVKPSIDKNNHLVLTPVGSGGEVRTLGLGQANLVPCAGSVSVEEGKVRVSCSFTHIPDSFVRAANGK
ncbi:MAG: DUF2993 domain-containing protein [Actinobacteria bacterium]|nr:DUF2993 domain-containing protein [Actinomycetota bacterium]MBV9253932.1 DUF2993 domain-containing protein [Actinomycetota bacterium]